MKRVVTFIFVLMLFSATFFAGFIRSVVAQGTIYIRPDGSVDPSTMPIQRVGNTYTFTANIYDFIVVEKDNIVIDGVGYSLQGTGSGVGINVTGSNITIKSMKITYFSRGINLHLSSNNTISGNSITNNEEGIWMQESKNNTIIGNIIANNSVGIAFWTYIVRKLDNIIYHNSFINNTDQVTHDQGDPFGGALVNIWDGGFPSGGNYWSDYKDKYPDAKERDNSGIWNTPYINQYVKDNYPLINNPISSIDTTPPAVSIISPENKSYAASNVYLTFTVNETAFRMAYSLDGNASVAIGGNTTLTELPEGSHSIIVYVTDYFGNTGYSNITQFAIDISPPSVVILSPENKTYDTTDISLTLTTNEPTSWMAYSLDGQNNVTIAGNVTLAALPEGSHGLVVYAADIAGNIGASEIIYFNIKPFPITLIVAVIAITIIVGAALLVYFTKTKKTTGKAA